MASIIRLELGLIKKPTKNQKSQLHSFLFSFFILHLKSIEQTNVFANAQKRKVRPFEGMTRKAIVIVPSEEDYKARIEAQEKAQCKDVPDNAVMEMKGIENLQRIPNIHN